jgi:hypothetical protein
MVKFKKIKEDNRVYEFPKIMESSEHTNKSYGATVYFEKPGCGIVLYAYTSSSLKAGQIVKDISMEYFKDFHGVIEMYNTNN